MFVAHNALINSTESLPIRMAQSVSIPFSDQDFVSKVINIVKSNAHTDNFNQIDIELRQLSAAISLKTMSPDTLQILVQNIKDLDVLGPRLPMTYSHLILDLGLNTDQEQLFTLLNNLELNEEFRIECARL